MFSKYFEKRSVNSSYIPVSLPHDLIIHLIHDSEQEGVDYDSSLRDILDGSNYGDAASTFIFEAAGHGLFVLWLARSGALSTNSLEDALVMSQQFIEKTNQQHMCISFAPERDEMTDEKSRSVLAVLTRYDRNLPSLGLPLAQKERITQRQTETGAGRLTFWTRALRILNLKSVTNNRFLVTLGFFASILIVLIFSVRYFASGHSPDELHSWIQYDTSGSVGPKYQLSVNGHNASKLSSYMEEHGEWALRIDDQAIIPLHLMDEDEKRYQKWFEGRYPATNEIRLNGNYINETWLNSPLIDHVPVDDMFHFSHCVLAVKRYIKAKENRASCMWKGYRSGTHRALSSCVGLVDFS